MPVRLAAGSTRVLSVSGCSLRTVALLRCRADPAPTSLQPQPPTDARTSAAQCKLSLLHGAKTVERAPWLRKHSRVGDRLLRPTAKGLPAIWGQGTSLVQRSSRARFLPSVRLAVTIHGRRSAEVRLRRTAAAKAGFLARKMCTFCQVKRHQVDRYTASRRH